MAAETTAREARETASPEVLRAIVLHVYDVRRTLAGHDFGGGQRRHELNRSIDRIPSGEQSRLFVDWLYAKGLGARAELIDPAVLAAAAREILGPRVRRLEREPWRASTPASVRTRKALQEALGILGGTS